MLNFIIAYFVCLISCSFSFFFLFRIFVFKEKNASEKESIKQTYSKPIFLLLAIIFSLLPVANFFFLTINFIFSLVILFSEKKYIKRKFFPTKVEKLEAENRLIISSLKEKLIALEKIKKPDFMHRPYEQYFKNAFSILNSSLNLKNKRSMYFYISNEDKHLIFESFINDSNRIFKIKELSNEDYAEFLDIVEIVNKRLVYIIQNDFPLIRQLQGKLDKEISKNEIEKIKKIFRNLADQASLDALSFESKLKTESFLIKIEMAIHDAEKKLILKDNFLELSKTVSDLFYKNEKEIYKFNKKKNNKDFI